ncbi:MAG TPA: hypothetical protein VFH72_14980 [Candidatus Baltobacteraceae bacterium]|jgi:hypothetical protein|nr:hypothetical protein [Candidatus Baltobacteraceae bacterium]
MDYEFDDIDLAITTDVKESSPTCNWSNGDVYTTLTTITHS